MESFLTNEERNTLKAQHRLERDKRICYRINAVLLYDKGWIFSEIANALLLSEGAIRIHIREFEESKKLKPENGGSSEKLSFKQSEELEQHLQTHSYLHVQEDKTLNANSTIAFFKRIEAAYPTMNKVHIFADNAPYYKNKEVKKHIKTSKIVLHYLPPYSPNLNPIERLWKWMKERVMYNTYYEDFDAFRNAVLGFLQSVSSLDPTSILGQEFISRVRDRFRAIEGPALTI